MSDSARTQPGASPARLDAQAQAPRPPYEPPRLEAIGSWRSLTLQQSVPIGPGGFLLLKDPALHG